MGSSPGEDVLILRLMVKMKDAAKYLLGSVGDIGGIRGLSAVAPLPYPSWIQKKRRKY